MCDSKKASNPGLKSRGFFCCAYSQPMLWAKVFHIVFIAGWFAGLFYLPRIFVNLAQVPDGSAAERDRLLLMARKLLRFTRVLAIPALGFGLALWLIGGFAGGWVHVKLAMALVGVGYMEWCGALLRRFGAGGNRRGHVWYRWFNELPIVVMLMAVAMAVFKPF
jgi:putative membrane protein